MFYVVAYDTPSTKRRTRLFKAMKGFGVRTQFSLFECELDDREFPRMMKAIVGIVSVAEDNVKVYALCRGCLKGIHVLGTARLNTEPDHVII